MLAHDRSKPRTSDVSCADDVTFESFFLSNHVREGLRRCGFRKPSPVQVKAIPFVKDRRDALIQAKSGTGKTCVFVIAALEAVKAANNHTQVVILAPTREIAVQISQACLWIGRSLPDLKAFAFIGGLSVEQDVQKLKRCHIIVGTPGRLSWLFKQGYVLTQEVKLLVLDEADKMLEKGMKEDVKYIARRLPRNKQVICCSATFTSEMEALVCALMRNPEKVITNPPLLKFGIKVNEEDGNLVGIKQFLVRVEPHHALDWILVQRKFTALLTLLQTHSFSQCMVFVKYQTRAENLADDAAAAGWPSACLSAHLDQRTRLKALSDLQKLHCRILFATDVGARGIDVENVDLVVNFDVPTEPEGYLHRVGRAGRFGSAGIGVTLVSGPNDEKLFNRILGFTGSKVYELPLDYSGNLWEESVDSFVVHEVAPRTSEKFVRDEAYASNKFASKLVQPAEGKLSRTKRKSDSELSRIFAVMKDALRSDIDSNEPLLSQDLYEKFSKVVGSPCKSETEEALSWLDENFEESDSVDSIWEKYKSAFSEETGHEDVEDQPRREHDFVEHNASRHYNEFWLENFLVETRRIRDEVFEIEYEKTLREFV
ncbi:unnamed protein product [Notodromas monacha]|uniref:RNA helicase n=1 Tax=Notodromas monacha TaxID=399045 RepID=A0A7R9BGS9_9CRUS|nr:unnamed protein product [Notodromas monacha]CAG0915034.1 unnamed protein product [Notodromas monacha]